MELRPWGVKVKRVELKVTNSPLCTASQHIPKIGTALAGERSCYSRQRILLAQCMSATICPYQIILWAKHSKTVKATLGFGPGGLTPEVTATTQLVE